MLFPNAKKGNGFLMRLGDKTWVYVWNTIVYTILY